MGVDMDEIKQLKSQVKETTKKITKVQSDDLIERAKKMIQKMAKKVEKDFKDVLNNTTNDDSCLFPFSNARNESIFSHFRREEMCSLDQNHLYNLTMARINHLVSRI